MGFKHGAAAFVLAAFTAISGVSAQQNSSPQERPAVPETQARYARALHLAYVRTPSVAVNEESRLGVSALSAFVNEMTSVESAGVVGIDIENDDITLLPFLYWPILSSTKPLSDKAQTKVQAYINGGGVIIFDLRVSPGGGDLQILDKVLGRVRLHPVVRMPNDHALTRNFYNVSGLPGSNNNGSIRIQVPSKGKITSVIIGERNWAAAWAAGHTAALRSGVNMVIYMRIGERKNNSPQASTPGTGVP